MAASLPVVARIVEIAIKHAGPDSASEMLEEMFEVVKKERNRSLVLTFERLNTEMRKRYDAEGKGADSLER